MEIRINGVAAVLKKGTSFEYVSENNLFSGSDSYTLSISLPLRGCRTNTEIFGRINRADVIAGKVIFDCEIRHRDFYKAGSVTITEITETEVKVQFLEGRSEQNFDKTFDDVYINELELGTGADADDSTPAKAWSPADNGMRCVALPWVNDSSGNIQNLAQYEATTKTYKWHTECKGRSWQPYLIYIAKKICDAVGYSCDFSQWEADERYKYLLICNALPYAWDMPEFARALPHWTVDEFFEKLGLFLGGEFSINHRGKSVTFAFTENTLAALPPVELTDIIDEHNVDVSVEDSRCEYAGAQNLVYKKCDHDMWKYYSCDWFIKDWKNRALKYDTLTELISSNKKLSNGEGAWGRKSNADKVLYAADVDAYFIVRSLYKTLVEEREGWAPNIYSYKMELRPLNMFGGSIADESDDAQETEIEFIPPRIDETEDKYGRLLFMSLAGYDEPNAEDTFLDRGAEAYKKKVDETLYQPYAAQALIAGEAQEKAEYYDCIYIAWWDGAGVPMNGQLPHPYAEDIEVKSDWSGYQNLHFSLRIKDRFTRPGTNYSKIDTQQKTTFKFLADSIPDPKAVFFIRGKKYLCEKLTATFTEEGMSQLIKGVFWPIKD